MFFVDAQEKCRRICNIELHYASIALKEGVVALCVCEDAELFSRNALNQLLLTDDGCKSVLSVALSLDDRGLKMRAVSLK